MFTMSVGSDDGISFNEAVQNLQMSGLIRVKTRLHMAHGPRSLHRLPPIERVDFLCK